MLERNDVFKQKKISEIFAPQQRKVTNVSIVRLAFSGHWLPALGTRYFLTLRFLDPDSPFDPDSSIDPDSPLDPNSSIDPDSPLDPDSSIDPDSPLDPDSSTDPDSPLDADSS